MEGKTGKKKKYVKMKNPSEVSTKQKSDVANEQDQGQTLFRSKFDYNFHQIVNHILAKILPDPKFIIRLSQKLIFGREKQIDQIIGRLDENIKYYSGCIIELYEEFQKEDIEYQIEECFKAKIFGSKLIQKCIADFFKGTRYQLDCTSFLKIFQSEENQRLFVRISKEFKEEFLSKIKDKACLLNQINISDKEPIRGNRKNLRKQYGQAQIEAEQFDQKGFKEFLHKSQKLDRKDIEIIETKNSHGYTEAFTIKLCCHQEEGTRKLQAFNYYFKHQNFIHLPLKESKHKSDLIDKYRNFDKNWLKIRLIRGYKSSKWDDKTLLYKIRCNNISNKKTNFTNQIFEAFHLIGLLPKVRQYLEELQYEINNVPLDDVKEELFLDFDQIIKDALKNSQQIQEFIQDFIKSYAKKFNSVCQIVAVKFPLRGVKINILVKPGKEKDFPVIRDNLEIVMLKEVRIHNHETDFVVDQQFIQKLKNQGIKVIGTKQRSFTYIESNQNLASTINTIQQVQADFQSFTQEYILIQAKSRIQRYLELIKTIKENDQFKTIYMTDPETKDKIRFKIGFVGQRKKNQAFVKLVKQKINELQKTLGSYYQAIDSQKGRFLIKDNFIQQKIHKNFNISMVVDMSYSLEAKLKILPLSLNKTVYFYKSKALNVVPFGSSLYFTNLNQLQKFDQKFLDVLKIKAKRMTKKDLVSEVQGNRQLNIFYKNEMNEIQLVSNALDSSQNKTAVCFIMPRQKKDKFVRDILTILTSNKVYQKMDYQIYIIETDQDSDINTIINLPQYSQLVVKQDIIIQWECQGRPYSKIGNNKINDTIARGLTKCLISQEDILSRPFITRRTHICDLKKKTILCIRTQQQIPLIFHGSQILFSYKGQISQLSTRQINLIKSYENSYISKFHLDLIYYELDFQDMVQVNIFTGKKRSIRKLQKVIIVNTLDYQGKVQAFYNCPSPQIIYSFQENDSKKLYDAINEVSNYIDSKLITKVIKLKQIGSKYKANMQEVIRSKSEQDELRYQYDSYNNQITVESLSQLLIERFERIVQSQAEYLSMLQQMEKTVKTQKSFEMYPSNWEPQTQQIEMFDVLRTSAQFQEVQKQFTVCPIYSLHRIQNKFLYKKYKGQLDHLTFLNNNNQPKEMMLFHGTHKNQPQNIWGDKEEGFNINYSRDQNYLGRGIYFAQKSQYSFTYKYREQFNLYSMFLCHVIVGDSQEMVMSIDNGHVKDTKVKNNSGLKYQSMKGKHSISDIYVVYKDKRAYPAYLIKFKV